MSVFELLEDFYNITRAVLDRHDSHKLLQTIVDSSSRVLNAPYAKIGLCIEGGLLTYAITRNHTDKVGNFSPWEESQLAWQVVKSKDVLLLNDYPTYPHKKQIYDTLNFQTVIGFPLLANDECLGVLSLARTQTGQPFNEQNVIEGKLLAQLVVLVLEQQKLFQATLDELAERHKTEHALRETEERYRTLVDSLAEGIVMQDNAGIILACNKAAEEILGLSVEQMMGRTSIDPRWRAIYEDYTPFPGENHPSMVTLRTGTPLTDVVMGVHKPNGDLTWISVNSRPIFRDADHLPYAVIASFVDITKRKEAEKRALQLAAERQRANLLTNFIQDASHEFRTPLSIIQTSLYLLNRSNDPALRASKTRAIETQVRLIDRLIEMLVLQVRLESGKWTELKIGIDLNQLLSEILTSFHSEITNHKHTLEYDTTQTDERSLVIGDQGMIVIALRFIIDNAIRYTADGGHLTIRLRRVPQFYEISVEDTGVGISSASLPYIFDRFYRRDVAHTTPGFGLGLSIAKRIIEEHGGDITVQSEIGVGSTFTIRLSRSN